MTFNKKLASENATYTRVKQPVLMAITYKFVPAALLPGAQTNDFMLILRNYQSISQNYPGIVKVR